MGLIQRDAIRMTIITYLGVVIGYVNKVLLFTNILSTEQVGLANLLVSVATLYASLSAFGANSITLRFFPFFRSREKEHHGFLFMGMLLISIGFLFMTLLFFIFKQPIVNYYSAKSPLLLEYYLYLVPLGLSAVFYNFFESYLRSLYKNVVPTFVYEVVLRLLITISVVIYALGWVGFETFVLVYVIANSLPAVILLLYTAFLKQLFIRPQISRLGKRIGGIILVYGLFAFANGASGMVLNVLDALMVAGEIGMKETGIFTTMIYVASVLLVPNRAIGKVVSPLIADCWKSKDMERMESIYKKVTAANLVSGLLLFMLLWVNIDSLFAFMGKDFREGKYVFLYIALARLFDMYTGLNGLILSTSRKFRYDFLFTVFLVVITIVINKLLIPYMGMEGAAVGTCIAIVLYNLFRTLFVKAVYKMHPFEWKHVPVMVIGAVTIWIAMLIPVIDNLIIDMVVRSAVVTVLFILPVYFLKILPEMNRIIEKYVPFLK